MKCDLGKSRAGRSNHRRREVIADQVEITCVQQLSQAPAIPATEIKYATGGRQPMAHSLEIQRVSERFLWSFCIPVFELPVQIDQCGCPQTGFCTKSLCREDFTQRRKALPRFYGVSLRLCVRKIPSRTEPWIDFSTFLGQAPVVARFSIFAHVSRRPMVRLKTTLSPESRSTQ